MTLYWLVFKDANLEFYLKWDDVPRQYITTSLLDRWKKTKTFITKRSDCLKRKRKAAQIHGFMSVRPEAAEFCSCHRLWIWVIPKIKLWSGIMIQGFLSLMYFTLPNYLHFFPVWLFIYDRGERKRDIILSKANPCLLSTRNHLSQLKLWT